MLSQQIRSSASLLDSVDAVRNWRAVVLMMVTLAAAVLVAAVGFALARLSFVFTALFVLAAYGVAFYGANAVGMMMMDEAHGQPSRPPMAAVLSSLATSHRLILLLLLVGALYLVGFLALALVLFLCKIPVLGPLLYTVVFPVSVVVVGIALFAVPTVIFPLAAPAIWSGGGVLSSLSQLSAIARQRLIMVLLLMVAVAFIAFFVGSLIGAILFSGAATTALLSLPILGMGGFSPEMLMGGMMGMGGMGGGGGGHAFAALVGGGLLFAAGFTLPGLVYLRGACAVYLRAIDGLDLAAEQAAFEEKLAAARDKAKNMQAQAQAAAQQYTQRNETPPAAPAAPALAAAAAPVVAPAAAPVATTAHCPACQGEVAADDRFCGHCGHSLGQAPTA